jgi:RNA polymerase sigma-70 factor (ECF subfamily)
MKRRVAEVVQDHYQEVLGFVRARVGPSGDAEDVVQEVFANAAEALAASARKAPPTLGWLYTVARRRLVDESRHRRRRRTVSLEVVPDLGGREEPYGGLVAQAFDRALASLTDGQRQVVVLRLLEGRTFAEIAASLETTEEACRMRFMRALQQLRADFEREGLTP